MWKRPTSRPASISRPGGTAQWNRRVEAGHALARRQRLDVFQERGEAADDAARGSVRRRLRRNVSSDTPASSARARQKSRQISSGSNSRLSAISTRHSRSRQFHDFGVIDFGRLLGLAARLHAAPPHVAHAEREQAFGRHQPIGSGAGLRGRENRSARSIEKPCGTLSVVHSR